jgi:molybdate transport system permease protein
MRSRLLLVAALVLLAASPSHAAPPAADRGLVVSAAVSLTEALQAIARDFQARTGIPVSLNLGGSNSLARQVLAGAPVDVFVSADEQQMRALQVAGLVAPGARIDLLVNRLVVVTAAGRRPPIRGPEDLLSPSVRRVAIGDPAAVPAGVYARQYFERIGLWKALEPKLVPGTSVRASLAALDAGEVDAAVVYATDARVARRAVIAYEVPPEVSPLIVYSAAVVATAPHPAEARAFLDALQQPAAREVFARLGFAPAESSAKGGAAASAAAPAQEPGAEPSPRGVASPRGVDWPSLWQIGRFTLGVAFAATLLMLPPAIIVAWVLARGRFFGKVVIETLVSLPLVLPPVATGLILLRLLGRRGPFGALLDSGGVDIVFTWKAVVIAMAIMGFPLVVRTARAGFEQVTRRYEQVAETLGAGPSRVFFTISLPLASRNVLAGALLGFSRALGEFGATIVVAGSLPGRTRTLAVAIFGYLETGQDSHAMVLLAASVAIAFGAVWISNLLVKGQG